MVKMMVNRRRAMQDLSCEHLPLSHGPAVDQDFPVISSVSWLYARRVAPEQIDLAAPVQLY
jgi:hypothetical protein